MPQDPEVGSIILAEDDPDDQLLILRAIKANGIPYNVVVVQDGEELMDYLSRCKSGEQGQHALPQLILLDLNMPRKDGREALREIKSDQRLRGVPVIVLTTSMSPEDVTFSYGNGVNAYIAKPARYEELHNVFKSLKDFWFTTVRLPSYS